MNIQTDQVMQFTASFATGTRVVILAEPTLDGKYYDVHQFLKEGEKLAKLLRDSLPAATYLALCAELQRISRP